MGGDFLQVWDIATCILAGLHRADPARERAAGGGGGGGGGHICSSASAQQLRGGRQLPDLAHYLGNAGPEVVVDLLQGDARVIHSVMQQRCHDCRLNPAHTELAFLSCNTSYLH